MNGIIFIIKILILSFFSYNFLAIEALNSYTKRDSDTEYPENGKNLVQTECKSGKCNTISKCFLEFGNKDYDVCSLSDSIGVCCSIDDENQTYSDGYNPIPFDISIQYSMPSLPKLSPMLLSNALNTSGKNSKDFITNLNKLESKLNARKLITRVNSAASFHQSFIGKNPEVFELSQKGLIGIQASKALAKSLQLSPSQSSVAFAQIDLSQSPISDICPKEPECPSSKYRSADGSCNNVENSSWGMAMTAFNRVLNPVYADGFDKPRVAGDGSLLPNAREVSITLAPDVYRPDPEYTLMVMQFGQFLDHDLTQTAGTRTMDNQGIRCCGQEFDTNPELLHPACFPIAIPESDTFFRGLGKTCMEFVRSAAAPRPECKLGPREQLNQLSAYIDGGMIYGSSLNQSNSLRSLRDGKLKTAIVDDREFLPFQNTTNGCQIPKELQQNCFVAGDGRVNVVSSLTALQGIWLKEHNRIADTLKSLNPDWNDETLYQETRRIVIAELQHIVYNEFLPIIIGRQTMIQNGLLLFDGYSFRYSPNTNAGIFSGFATAAYRFHTLIPGIIELQNPFNSIIDRIQVRNQFFDPSVLYKFGGLEEMINALTAQPIQISDNFFTVDVTRHLFQPKNGSSGFDLVAINTQRGRDHGLPGYNAWRELCGLSRINNFEDLKFVFTNPSVAQGMSRIYKTVDDIDLFMAGFSEIPLDGALVGPTFACLIGEQFRRIKEGDRFWFENGGLDSSFTPIQLTEIRKSSLARVLCDNSEVGFMQPLAMVQPFNWNPKVSCNGSNIPRLDLSVWGN